MLRQLGAFNYVISIMHFISTIVQFSLLFGSYGYRCFGNKFMCNLNMLVDDRVPCALPHLAHLSLAHHRRESHLWRCKGLCAVKVSKEVVSLRSYESFLLRSYQAFLKQLLIFSKNEKSGSHGEIQHKRVAIRCLCGLLTSLGHFNYRQVL